jgi:hypothetical protein
VTHGVIRTFATQLLAPVRREARQWSARPLKAIVAELQAALARGEVRYSMGLYTQSGGHTVLPIAAERNGDLVSIDVYDPNWPGQDRFIEMDLEAQRWRFPYGEADPTAPQSADGPATVWFGDATDIDVVALSAREAPFLEPFTGAGGGRPQLAVTTSGRNWSVTGQRTGALVAGPASTPGDDAVRAVIRGGFGTTTMLAETTGDERRGMEFLIANMPDSDLQSLSADFLLENSNLAWQARRELPWGQQIPEAIFFNNVAGIGAPGGTIELPAFDTG